MKGRKLSKIHPVGQRRKQASLNAWACEIRRQNFLKFWPNTSCEFENLSVHFLCGLGNILIPTSPPGKNLHEYWYQIRYPWDCSGETCTQRCSDVGFLHRHHAVPQIKKLRKISVKTATHTTNKILVSRIYIMKSNKDNPIARKKKGRMGSKGYE